MTPGTGKDLAASVAGSFPDGAAAPPAAPSTAPGGALPAGPRRPERSARLGAAVLFTALLVTASAFVVARALSPSDLTAAVTGSNVTGGVVTPLVPGQSPLREGDVVLSVDGRRLATREMPSVEVGDRVVYQVLRDGHVVNEVVTIRRYPMGAALARDWGTVIVLAAFLAIAVYVFRRRPDDPAVRALLLLVGLAACASTSWVFDLEVIDLGGSPAWWAHVGGSVAYAMLWASVVHFALVFPEPRPWVDRRPRIVGLVYLVLVVVYAAHLALALPDASTPLERATLFADTTDIGIEYVAVLLFAGAVASQRGADAEARRRLRSVVGWFGFSIALDVLLWRLPITLAGEPLLPAPLHLLVFLPIPVAIAAAVLRRRLFEIDVVVRRSLVFAGLTVCLVAIYVVTVAALGRLFEDERGWVPFVATGVVAVAFAPLHQRLRRAATHVVYGYRDDPFAILTRLGNRLEELPSPDDVLPLVADTLAEALRLPYVGVELSYADGVEQVARHGTLVGRPIALPLEFRGERLGQLVVGERTPGEAFSASESRLLAELARHAGVAAHAVRLTRDLQRSRERLVTALEEERRRFRRDLHDGLAPTLAGAVLELQAVRRLATRDPERAQAMVARVTEEIQDAVADIRTLVYGLRPPALDQLGLVSALRERAVSFATPDGGGALEVTVEAEGDFANLPAAVEVAAYRIACEALHNASRHAGAMACAVRLSLNGALTLEVADDGRGLPDDYRPGTGLASMRERAEELGGSCTVEARASGGTVVSARLPLVAR